MKDNPGTHPLLGGSDENGEEPILRVPFECVRLAIEESGCGMTPTLAHLVQDLAPWVVVGWGRAPGRTRGPLASRTQRKAVQ